jgi:two-component system phosphate regulon response regulator PhoB
MSQLTTLIIASNDAAVADTLRPLLPALDVLHAPDPRVVQARHGEIWCFIDWMLAHASGLEMCRLYRATPATWRARVWLALEDLEEDTRRRALSAGADDYLLGPLSTSLIIDRLDRSSSLRRNGFPSERLQVGPLELDPAAHRVWFGDKPVSMRPRQFALLSYLMQNPDRVHSRAELIKILGRKGEQADERTVDAWVARLRHDLRNHGAPDPLRTVRDYGYVLDSH